MSGPDPDPKGAAPPEQRPAPKEAEPGRDAPPPKQQDGTPQQTEPEPEPDPFAQAGQSPLGETADTGGLGTAHAARENFAARTVQRAITVDGDNQYYEGNLFLTQQFGPGTGAVVVDGPVPREELDRLAETYLEVPGYQRMKDVLRERGLLALCGEPGSGRSATALALLAELTGNRVVRLDTDTALHQLTDEVFEEGHGYVLEVAAAAERPTGSNVTEPPDARKADADALNRLHLDRLSAQLCGRKAYGVLLVGGGAPAARLLRGRYGMPCTPPPPREVLHRHLRVLLTDAPAGAVDEALAQGDRVDVGEALGLDELLPGEAARLAELLARRRRGLLSDEQLLDLCATFARAQVRDWFAGADRPGTLPEALPAVVTAAFRIAVAVFNGSAYSLAAETAEQLALEMAGTLDPDVPVGRRLFLVHAEDRPATARSVLTDGELDFGDTRVPARLIRFRGARLAPAVLHEVWHGYHNVRGPVVRWLRALCADPRPELWVRASVAGGVLCSWDWGHGYGALVLPMAGSDTVGLRMAAATVLAEAAREPSVQPAVSGLLRQWAKGEHGALRATAVFTHGYGMAAGSVSGSLDELGRLARREEGARELPAVAHSVTRLLAGPEPETVVHRLGGWLRSDRQRPADVVLLTVINALRIRTTQLWGLRAVPELEPYASVPLLAARVAAAPRLAERLADLVWRALATARSGAAVLEALGGWMRQAAGDEEQMRTLCGFLPLLAEDRRDRDRLRHLLTRLVRDVDEPLDKSAARRMWDAVEDT